MTPIVFTLPWPPSALSPNTRGHWATLAKAKKRYRAACFIQIRADRVRCPDAPRLDVLLQFVPPDRRRYDRDNLVARMKAGLDGVADAWDIDDSQFVRVAGELLERDDAAGVLSAGVRVTVREHAKETPREATA